MRDGIPTETQTTGGGQPPVNEPTGGPPPEGGSPTPPSTPAGEPTGQGPQVFDAEYVRRLREEAAQHRVKAREAETARDEALAKVKEYEDAQLSVQERLEKAAQEATEARTAAEARAAVAERQAREAQTRYEVGLQAVAKGVVDPEVASDLVLRRLERADDGTVTSDIAQVLDAVLAEKPYLLSGNGNGGPMPPAPSTGPTNPPAGGRTSPLTAEDIMRMSPEEVSRRWEEI